MGHTVITGPEESNPPIFSPDSEEAESWKLGDPRKGRTASDVRPICMSLSTHIAHISPGRELLVLQPGLINQANGSAYIEAEQTKIACAVSISSPCHAH